MSKQSEAKSEQKYQEKPVFPMCSNCEHFKSDIMPDKDLGELWIRESNIRCGIGGFAVKKQGTCLRHQFKTV